MVMSNSAIPRHWLNDRKFFYKYMGSGLGKIVLSNRTLRWSTPGTLNDPYDIQFDLHIDIDPEELKHATLKKLWEEFYEGSPIPAGNSWGLIIQLIRERFPKLTKQEFRDQFSHLILDGLERMQRRLPEVQSEARGTLQKSKILCLGEVPDNIQMWSYYADGHRGIVLRFRSIPELDSCWGAARPVNYVRYMPRLIDVDFLSDMASGRRALNANEIIDRMVFTKAIGWAHEKEWRIFSGSGRHPDAPFEDITFHPLELDAVFFGSRMLSDEKKMLTSLIRELYPHVHILQARMADRQFQVNFELL